MKHPIRVVLFFLLLAGCAFAQSAPAADVSLGYSSLYILKGFTIWMNGGSGSVAVNANNWFAIAGQVGGYVGHIPQSFTGATYMVGPRIYYRKLDKVVPFGQALFGGSHFSTSTSGITGGGNEFAFMVGGGADVGLGQSRNVALRLAGDFVGIHSAGSISPSLQLAAGIVYRFGGK